MARKHKRLSVGGVFVEVPKASEGFRVITREGGKRNAYWYASDKAVARGYRQKTIRLHGDLDDIDQVNSMFALCKTYTTEMQNWLSQGDQPRTLVYDESLWSLFACWQTDQASTFRENRLSTQQLYIDQSKPIIAIAGSRRASAITGADLRGYFRELWAAAPPPEDKPDTVMPRRERRAFGAMDMLRDAVRYGCERGFEGCFALSTVLQGMKFRVDRSETVTQLRKPKKVAMGFEFAEAIIRKGLAMGTPRGRAVALGVAAQFEFTLRQIDVIGYLVPRDRVVMEPGMLALGKKAWKPGLRFEDFAAGVLDLSTTKNSTDAIFDVKEYPLFQLALAAVPESERIGPLVSVTPGEPVRRRFYAEIYREVADAAGVPATVWNARARHGGVTEGLDAGADKLDVSRHAQHTDVNTTTGEYYVANLTTTRRVIKKRVAKRKSDATDAATAAPTGTDGEN